MKIGAQTMSSISELIMRVNPSNEGITQAESWSRKALDITTDTKTKLQLESRKLFSRTPGTDPVCELALAVNLFNIGVFREVSLLRLSGTNINIIRMLDGRR